MDFSSGVFAIFINDLQFSDSKIGDYKFYYDGDSNDFVVKSKPELRYPRSAVVEDPNFLIFRETEVEFYVDEVDGDPDLTQLDFEVEPYEMSVF